MRKIIDKVIEWQNEGHKIALATVVKVYGSAPRPLGSKMAVNGTMDFIGSVSGGCIESDVIENALRVIDSGKSKLIHYGIADDTAWGLGLSCGGEIEVFIELFHSPASKQVDHFRLQNESINLLKNRRKAAAVTILTGKYQGEKLLFLPENPAAGTNKQLIDNDAIQQYAKKALTNQKSVKQQITIENETVDFFVDILSPQPTLIIVGGVHIAIPLVQIANIMDFKTIILDSRSAFATEKRFPHADEVIIDWPAKLLQEYQIDENTFIVFLSHDPKIDNPALKIALEGNAQYIGALGSRKTHRKRVESLIEMGVASEKIKKIHAPIGLDLGAFGAEQIALSIMAEIISVQNGIS